MGKWESLVRASDWAAHVGTVSFGPPAAADRLRRLEQDLGLVLPPDLRSFLAEADGVQGGFDDFLVLDAEHILEYTRDLRTDEVFKEDGDGRPQPVDHFLVFSNMLGNGDLYAYCMAPVEAFRPHQIVHWDHETNERSLQAADLHAFITNGNPGIR